ncbi:hypothetical protein [Simplicispira lacusdiani]|uniref:hypothetical protein n=1 Tax=Simplicispira lacusdiani TaxID=2213010 RepID=UPI000E769D0E|nr:hypothetical protein [Simplicispira lacusdiani]
MLNFYKPHWFYEALPYVYVGSGLVSLAVLDHLLSAFSGLMLVTAGLVVGKLRYDHRHWQRDKGGRSPPRRKGAKNRRN